MGNSSPIRQNEINYEEIIENDCYEEIDLKKINKILEQEKNWNKNSIIYSNKDLNVLNEENKENQDENKKEEEPKKEENEKKENEEKKNEEKNENIPIEQNKNGDENNNEVNQKEKEEKKEIANNKEEKNYQININKEENKEENKNIDDENNKNNPKTNPQVNGKMNRMSIKIKNLKPKIRPKNTRDEALRGPNSPKLTKKNRASRRKKDNIENKKVEDTSKNNNNKENNENKMNEDKITEKKEGIAPLAEKNVPTEEFEITNIISEYRLNHLKEDEIIYSGTLEKILKFPDKNSIIYSERFCIFTKNYFAYYKSKENFISLNKPMFKINNKFIIRIENTTLDGGSYYFGIICEVNDETRSLINKVNSFVTQEANTCELLLGFRAKEYSTMMKWVVVLKHFIYNQNERF